MGLGEMPFQTLVGAPTSVHPAHPGHHRDNYNVAGCARGPTCAKLMLPWVPKPHMALPPPGEACRFVFQVRLPFPVSGEEEVGSYMG